MKGDFTRFTFDRAKHYVAVLAQQGRVTVDADANELQDILEHLRETALGDVVGPVGVPAEGGGFEVTAPGGGLEVSAGRLYLEGILVENEDDVALDAQPHVPAGAALARASDGAWVPLADAPAGRYLAYLDVWRRHLTAIDDPSIREVALGGPDTATREQVAWQVRLARVGDVGAAVGCADPHPSWDAVSAAPTGTLAVRAEPDETAESPCIVPAEAGYRRLENQLYRIEIHDGGDTGVATWKASRDNGAVEWRFVGRSGDRLLVSRPGRDAADGFPSGSWAELVDDSHELAGLPGTLVRVVRAEGNALEIDPATATGSLDPADFPDNPRVRRWDTEGALVVEVGPGDGWLELEDGVQVRFAAGATWRTGDHWMVPARTATGDVEWPSDAVGDPLTLPPHGVAHHHARLAVVTLDGGAWAVEEDCRPRFPALTALRTLDYVSGDGQEVAPDPTDPGALRPLPQPLVAGVSEGALPVEGATVRFEVTAGAGALAGEAPGAAIDALTDAAGLASVAWRLDSATASQQVTARLLDPGGADVHLPLVYTANLSTAERVAYEPGACAPLAGTLTVQEAIDRLCALNGAGCATVVVTPGEGWQDVLEQLPDGEDAVVCLRPGEYPTDRPVVLAGKGHLVIHGGGATTRLLGPDLERVLVVEGCTSLTLADLDVRAGATGSAEERRHVNGAVTVQSTPVVHIERVRAACGAGTRRAASCVTVRAAGPSAPARVRVRDCDLTVGHRQVGLLLVDCDQALVEGNRVGVARKPGRLGLGGLLADARVRERLVARLAEPAPAPPARLADANTVIDVAGFRLAFNSPVPTDEWAAAVADTPPTEEERASAEGMTVYAERLAAETAGDPGRLPTFARSVEGLRATLGAQAFRRLTEGASGGAVMRRMLVAGDVQVAELATAAGAAPIRVGDDVVGVRSELPPAVLAEAVAADQESATVADAGERVKATSRRLLTDAAFRANFPAAVRWFDDLVANNPAVISRGIVVGGRVARSVEIASNTVDDAVIGIQVGLSHRAPATAPPHVAGRVRIVDNVVTLRLPVERSRGQYGVFLGNVEHGLVTGNDVRVSSRAPTAQVYDEGVRVWGHLGTFLGVRENVVGNAEAGIRVEPLDAPRGARQWFVVDNATPHAGQSVVAPQTVRRRDNVS